MSYAGRIRIGILMILLGVTGIIVGFGPMQFADRLSGRVDAEGTVQWGVSVDAVSADDSVSDGQYGAWKVDYEIDGASHTGVLIGKYAAGQTVLVSAPSDGSIYAVLHEGTPLALKILSWLLVPLALGLVVVGGWWLARGMRAQDAHNREAARRQLAQLYPHLFPPLPIAPAGPPTAVAPTFGPTAGPPATAAPPPVPGPPQPTRPAQRDPRADIFGPYDI